MDCVISSNKPLPIFSGLNIQVIRGGQRNHEIKFGFFVRIKYDPNASYVISDYIYEVLKQYKDPIFQVITSDTMLLHEIEESFQQTERVKSQILITK